MKRREFITLVGGASPHGSIGGASLIANPALGNLCHTTR